MPAAGQASARPLAICAAWYRALQVQPGVPGVSASVPGPPAGCMPSVGLAVRRSGCGGKSMVVACPQLSNSGTPHTVPWSRRPRVVTEATCEQVWPGPAAQGRWLGEDEGWTGRSQGPSVHSSAHQASVCVCVYMCAVSLHAHTCTHMLDTQCTHMYVLCTCMYMRVHVWLVSCAHCMHTENAARLQAVLGSCRKSALCGVLGYRGVGRAGSPVMSSFFFFLRWLCQKTVGAALAPLLLLVSLHQGNMLRELVVRHHV